MKPSSGWQPKHKKSQGIANQRRAGFGVEFKVAA
jgi:hypothetical protein